MTEQQSSSPVSFVPSMSQSSVIASLAGGGNLAAWIRSHLDYPHKDWCLIWPFGKSDTGYAFFGSPTRRVHRIMCEYRHGPAPTPEYHAAHSCDRGHEACVNPWHVDWKTPSENQIDRRRSGIKPSRKLTPEQAREIRDLKGLEHTKDTAARYGIKESNVRHIQEGRTWRAETRDSRIFTPEEVDLIRSPVGRSKPIRLLAEEFGVHRSVIDRIRNGRTYRYFLPGCDSAATASAESK